MDRNRDASSISGKKTGRNFSFMSRTTRGPARNVSNASQIASTGSGALAEKPTAAPSDHDQTISASSSTPPDQRRQSRMSLFDLFSKPKVERARGFQENGSASSRLTPSIERPKTPAEFYRQMDSILPPPSAQSQAQSTAFLPRSRLSQRRNPQTQQRTMDNWDPAPLFQAIPQAIKHGMAHGVNTSAEAIARAHLYRSNPLVQDLLGQSPNSIPDILEEMGVHNPNESSKRHSAVAENLHILDKHFVLVTAGRLVQYAGKGNYDRLPEKILHLGASSAAFACDLIPGKHWVLQIVQRANDDSTAETKQHKSLFSRLKVPTMSGRKNVSNFLMIFDGGKEMDLWLKAIRKVINEAGGRPHTSDPIPGEAENDEVVVANPSLQKTPSHRFLTQRDPRAPSRLSSRSPSVRSTRSKIVNPTLDTNVSTASSLISPVSPYSPSSVSSPMNGRSSQAFSGEAPSIGTSSASSDHVRLSELREGSRHSSSSADTAATSRCSTSPPSPVVGDFTEEEKLNPPSPISRTSSFKTKRFSVQTHSLFDADVDTWSPSEEEIKASVQSVSITTPISSSPQATETSPAQTPTEPTPLPAAATSTTESTRLMPIVIEEAEGSKSQRPTSTVGQLPEFAPRNNHRMSQIRNKPFVRPLPVRPLVVRPIAAEGEITSTSISQPMASNPVRKSGSLPDPPVSASPSAHPRGRRSHIVSGNYSLMPTIQPNPEKTPSPPQAIRRPSSVQISTDRVAFLSSRSLAGIRSASASPTPPSTEPPLSVQDAKREAAARRQSFTQYMLATSRARAIQLSSSTATTTNNVPMQAGILGGPVGGHVGVGGAKVPAAAAAAATTTTPSPPPIPAMNPRRQTKTIRSSMPVMSLQSLPPPMPPPTCPLPMLPPSCPLPPPPPAHASLPA